MRRSVGSLHLALGVLVHGALVGREVRGRSLVDGNGDGVGVLTSGHFGGSSQGKRLVDCWSWCSIDGSKPVTVKKRRIRRLGTPRSRTFCGCGRGNCGSRVDQEVNPVLCDACVVVYVVGWQVQWKYSVDCEVVVLLVIRVV